MTPLAPGASWVSLAAGLVAIVAVMTVVWIRSLRLRDASIVDGWWGPGFVICASVYVWFTPVASTRAVVTWVLLAVWAGRLAWHIVRRNHGAGEDPRYAAMRATHGPAFWWRSLFVVFWLQAVVLWMVSWPVWSAVTAAAPASLTTLDVLGVAVFLLGFSFEAIGDWQLTRFRAVPANKGRVLDRGLWRYTRHPNYFGDATLWWGLGLLGIADGPWWVLVGPLLMTVLLVKVSGVALLERGLAETKPGYRDYVARTSAFVPWWPKSRE